MTLVWSDAHRGPSWSRGHSVEKVLRIRLEQTSAPARAPLGAEPACSCAFPTRARLYPWKCHIKWTRKACCLHGETMWIDGKPSRSPAYTAPRTPASFLGALKEEGAIVPKEKRAFAAVARYLGHLVGLRHLGNSFLGGMNRIFSLSFPPFFFPSPTHLFLNKGTEVNILAKSRPI